MDAFQQRIDLKLRCDRRSERPRRPGGRRRQRRYLVVDQEYLYVEQRHGEHRDHWVRLRRRGLQRLDDGVARRHVRFELAEHGKLRLRRGDRQREHAEYDRRDLHLKHRHGLVRVRRGRVQR